MICDFLYTSQHYGTAVEFKSSVCEMTAMFTVCTFNFVTAWRTMMVQFQRFQKLTVSTELTDQSPLVSTLNHCLRWYFILYCLVEWINFQERERDTCAGIIYSVSLRELLKLEHSWFFSTWEFPIFDMRSHLLFPVAGSTVLCVPVCVRACEGRGEGTLKGGAWDRVENVRPFKIFLPFQAKPHQGKP